jgi:pimeloyl-ACP methyl ester carboxylesterase
MERHDIRLKEIRGFHVGGALHRLVGFKSEAVARVEGDTPTVMDMNGDHMAGQMYATHYRQAEPEFVLPLLLWHGGGLTGACWEDTPDGGQGWLDYFLRHGFDVVVSDAFERGRASWPPYPQFLGQGPEHRSLNAVWHHFRFGAAGTYPPILEARSARKMAYPGLQFSIEHLEQFGRQFVPRWVGTEDLALKAYGALLQKIGPCVVIGHSQGGYYALQCARLFPELVKAVVAVEPPAVPGAVNASVVCCPHLFIWGDYIHGKSETWSRYFRVVEDYRRGLSDSGTLAEVMELPALGVRGNSHMLIMDRNNQLIAKLVQDWLTRISN